MEIKVLKNVMMKNEAQGRDNRALFLRHGIFTVNFTSSPGAGKTTLLENSLHHLVKRYQTAVIEGDLFTSRDAERLQHFDIPLVQINTEGGCHLDARMIHSALEKMDVNALDLLFIENVGNLVCPADFDLGEHMRVLLYAITEGPDKPKKYATMFKYAHAILINKVDLAGPCRIDLDALEREVREVNPTAKVFRIAATEPDSLLPWVNWLDEQIRRSKKN